MAETQQAESKRTWSISIGRILRDAMPLAALVIVVMLFSALDRVYGEGKFLTPRNFAFIVCDRAYITIGALGMMLIIAAGGIDLSAGTMLGLCTAVIAAILSYASEDQGGGTITAIAIAGLLTAILTGAACGLLNGALISGLRLPPFIVTLGAMTIYVGLAHLLSGATTVTPATIPDWLRDFLAFRRFGHFAQLPPLMPLGIWIGLGLAGTLVLLVRRTVLGRHILAVGANEVAAKLCGIQVVWLRAMVYTMGGALFGTAAIYQFAMIRSYTPSTGQGNELDIIAAVVIGGGSLNGGKASVLGTIVGSLLMAVIRSGCTQLGISNPIQYIIVGVIIIAAVLFDRLTPRA